ncbi:hypothetical protein ACQ4PT_019735 [Festuca glaucescens]
MVKKGKGAAAGANATSKKIAAPASSTTMMIKKGAAAPPAAPEKKSGGWTKSTFKPKDLQLLREPGLVSAGEDDVKFPGDELTSNAILHIARFITVCECYLGIHPHWGLWRYLYTVKRHVSGEGAYAVSGIIVSVRSDAEYFDFWLPASVQNWRNKWFYIRDVKASSQLHGLPPFSVVEHIKPKRSWKNKLTEYEAAEVNGLVAKIKGLRDATSKKTFGLQILSTFLKRRIQPLQARVHTMWMYSGASDPTRAMVEELSSKELKTRIVSLTRLKCTDPLPGEPPVAPFGENKKLPEGHEVLEKLPPLPKIYKKSEDVKKVLEDDEDGEKESLESPPPVESADETTGGGSLKRKLGDDEGEGSGDSSSSTSHRREEPRDDGAAEPHEPTPSEPTTKKQRLVPDWRHEATVINTNSSDKTEEEIEELKKKIDALEKGAQIAINRALAEAQEREDERLAEAASREKDLATRLHALAEKISGAIEVPLDSDDQAHTDSLASAVAAVEGCGVQVEALASRLKGGLQRFYANVSSKKKLKERSFGELVSFLCALKDPLLGYSSDQTRTGAELALTLAMGHGIEGDYVNAASSFPTGPDGEEVDLTEYS